MTRNLRTCALAAAVLGSLVAGSAAAAVRINDTFDGNWYAPETSGRGISFDFVPDVSGDYTSLLAPVFSYDNDGNPMWLIVTADIADGNVIPELGFASTGLKIFRTEGGTFGPNWTPNTAAQVGTASLTVKSCKSMTLALDMDVASGLEDITFNLAPLNGLGQPNCAYQREFTACPSFATAVTGLERACELSGTLPTGNVTLTNEITWVLNGLVKVGGDNTAQTNLTIEPGTLLVGAGGSADYLYVQPGSKIFANGTKDAPIILTSLEDATGGTPAPGDVGGLVVSGNAPVNACPSAPFNCTSEFDPTLRFGGGDANDSSGEISYMQVRYAGYVFQPDSEVNAFTFQGVGRGTKVSHIQAYRGQDDGVEFFGGNVNVKHLVVTEGGDDGIDWDLGWDGKIQYALVSHGAGLGEDRGIEAANNPDDNDALPRATPPVANLTLLGNGSGSHGVELKQGSGGQLWNSIVAGFPTSCLRLTGAATANAAGTPGNTSFAGVIVDCTTNFNDGTDVPAGTTAALFAANDGNAAVDPQLDGYVPASGSPALSDGQVIEGDDFFDFTGYRGAFDGKTDWTAGWTRNPGGDSL